MIFQEIVNINGKNYMRTYSDTYTIMRDGVEYSEAVDPINSGREYTETENLLIIDEENI